MSAARSRVVTTSAPPPSLTGQHSSRWNGKAIGGEASTSFSVSNSGRNARGSRLAQRDWATGTSARSSGASGPPLKGDLARGGKNARPGCAHVGGHSSPSRALSP